MCAGVALARLLVWPLILLSGKSVPILYLVLPFHSVCSQFAIVLWPIHFAMNYGLVRNDWGLS